MQIAIIGGGINGVMAAWEFAKHGHSVDLYERNGLMCATSSASTKMLHGGLRYLENGHIGLVREALQERAWWVSQAPHLVRPFELVLPVYRGARSRVVLGMGVNLYDWLAIGSGFPASRWLSADNIIKLFPTISRQGLKGGYSYWDAQMDDYQLGLWAADQARNAGAKLMEHMPVSRVSIDGTVYAASIRTYDRVVNVTGPWAAQLLQQSGISSGYKLDLIRGSHLIINRRIPVGCVLQVPQEKRLVFLLPYGEGSLLGTTEIPHRLPDPIEPSGEEIAYLQRCHSAFFADELELHDITHTFAGVRPVVAGKNDFSSASRESAIERQGKLISVFGGKWTTSHSLAKKIASVSLIY